MVHLDCDYTTHLTKAQLLRAKAKKHILKFLRKPLTISDNVL